MSDVIKLSSPATREFWEIPVLHEDEHLLALSKPAGLLTSPDRYDAERPNLMRLLHEGIEQGKPWASSRHLDYLMNAHRLDLDTSGVILMAKNKPALVALANQFGEEKPQKVYAAVVKGSPIEDRFTVNAPLAPHPTILGRIRVDPKTGKRSVTEFEVRLRFKHHTLLTCRPKTGRTHQIRVHLAYSRLPIAGDTAYGGKPLFLSQLKRDYRLKPGAIERPLLGTTALHAEELRLPHPITGQEVVIRAPWPRDLTVAVKYLRRYSGGFGPAGTDDETDPTASDTPGN